LTPICAGVFFVAQSGRADGSARYGRIINIGSVTSVAGYAGLAPTAQAVGGFDN